MKKLGVGSFPKTVKLATVTALLIFNGGAKLAHGQSYQTFQNTVEKIRTEYRWKVGPFRIFPRIQLRDIGYDDNIYNQRDDEDPVSDFSGTFSPEIKSYVLFRKFLILALTENPEYVFYTELTRERGWNNSLSSEIRLLVFNRFVISGRYGSSNYKRRATSEFDIRAREFIDGISGSIFYETTRQTALGISYEIQNISYEDISFRDQEISLSRKLSRKEKSQNMEFYYRIFSDSTFFMSAGFTDYSFSHFESRERDSYSYRINSGVFFPILGTLRGTLSLGYKKLVPRYSRHRSFSGLVGDTSLSFRSGRFALRVGYERDIPFSYSENNLYFIENRYGAGITIYLTDFVRVDYDMSYGIAHYSKEISIINPDGVLLSLLRRDVYQNHSIGLVFRIYKQTGLGLTVNYWERDSNYWWENRNKIFIGGYVTYDF